MGSAGGVGLRVLGAASLWRESQSSVMLFAVLLQDEDIAAP